MKNYAGNNRLRFENSALAREDGFATFYRLRETTDPMPHWYDQLGTLNRDVILKHKQMIPEIESYLIEETVSCISFGTLARKHEISKIDLILIDTEGSDLDVLRQIDFSKYMPSLLIYEQKHLSPIDQQLAIDMLKEHGYSVFRCRANNVAASAELIRWWWWNRV